MRMSLRDLHDLPAPPAPGARLPFSALGSGLLPRLALALAACAVLWAAIAWALLG
jgi:hypothetical protein